jgi:UDP-N-acetylglucosamine diphosphorylase/glucosamine-1-phosphate N-acetyltransferase
MNLVLFEDGAYRTLAPLTHTRPVFLLRVGAFTMVERIRLQFPKWRLFCLCRPYLAPVTRRAAGPALVNQPPESEGLFLNGAVLLHGSEIAKALGPVPIGSAVICDGRLVAARVKESQAFGLFEHLLAVLAGGTGAPAPELPIADSLHELGIEVAETSVPLVRNSWNLVEGTEELVQHDWAVFRARGESPGASVSPAAHMLGEDSIYVGPGAQVEAGAVIDGGKGPVMLDEGAKVMSNAVVYGPCYVGKNTLIKAGAKIYGPCSFGPVCKLGGEIAESVVLGYSNKQHDGFLGHAYVGEWVNIGAGTEVSDLNNNYGTVRTWVDGAMVDSGSMFVGPTIADHTKTGINTMLNSGTVVGFCSNIFGSDYLPKFVPSFSWGGRQKLVEHDRDKAFETAARMTARRRVIMDDVDKALFESIYELTKPEREGQVK